MTILTATSGPVTVMRTLWLELTPEQLDLERHDVQRRAEQLDVRPTSPRFERHLNSEWAR